MNGNPILDSDDLNEGLARLSPEEHDMLAPVLGNVTHQHQFRKQIRAIGIQKVQHLLNKAFPEQGVTIQDFRRSLAYKLAEEKGAEAAKAIMQGKEERTVRLGEREREREDR